MREPTSLAWEHGPFTTEVMDAESEPSTGLGLSDAPTPSRGQPGLPGRSRVLRRIGLTLGAAVALLVVAFAAYYFLVSRRTINSIAVLPFANDSGDPNADYLSDGITESIIRSLSQLPELKIMSRNAVFRFKGKGVDPQEIGRSLRVGAVLAGRVLKVGDRLVINAELIDGHASRSYRTTKDALTSTRVWPYTIRSG